MIIFASYLTQIYSMKNPRRGLPVLLNICVLIFFHQAPASDHVDSLQNKLQGAEGIQRVEILNQLAWELKYSHPDHALEYAREAASMAESWKSKIQHAFACRNIGALLFLKSDFEESRTWLNKAVQLAQEADALFQEAKALNLLGLIEREKLNYKQSLDYLNRALEIYRQLDIREEMTGVMHNLAFLYTEMNDKASALEIYHQVLEEETASGNDYGIARTANNLGYLYTNLDKLERALEYYNLAVEKSKKTNNLNYLASAYHGLGNVWKQMEEPDKGVDFYRKAISINKKLQNLFWLGNNYNSIAYLYFDRGDTQKAISCNDSAIAIYEKIGLAEEKYISLSRKADYYFELENYRKSESIYRQMLKISDSLPPISPLQAYWGMYKINRQMGDPSGALNWLEKYKATADSLDELEDEKLVMEVEARYDLKRMKAENDHLKEENQLKQKVIASRSTLFVVSLIFAMILAIITVLLYRSRRKLRLALNELKGKNTEIERTSAQLRELNATKDKFFSIIAHDLRNPFNSLLGLSELLHDEAKSANDTSITQYAEMIHQTSRSAYVLLENLLQWSRTQWGMIRYNPGKIELGDFMNDLLPILSEPAKKKKITISLDIPDQFQVYADTDMLASVFRNLLSNAVKFTPSGGEIFITAYSKNTKQKICVADTGIGMTPEETSRLFNIENTFSNHGTENETGSGIGLILCKEFIEKHGGDIWVESQKGEGSKFCFYLGKSTQL